MRIAVTTVSVLLAAILLVGCSNTNEEEPGTDPSSEPSSTPTASESAAPAADLGVLVERPGYSFNLPTDWVDSTGNQALADPEDAYGSVDTDADHLVTVDAQLDVSQSLFDHGLKDMIDNLKNYYASDGKKLADTTWAGETAIHVRGDGQKSDTRAQAFYLRHDNVAYIICVQTPGNWKQNQAAVDAVRANWAWQ